MRRRSLTSTFVRRLASTFTRLHNSVATITSKISSTIEAAAGPALGTIKRRARTAGATRLRIWGSGVRISPGAPLPYKTANPCCGGCPVGNHLFQGRLIADNADRVVIDLHAVDDRLDISFTEGDAAARDVLPHGVAEPFNYFWVNVISRRPIPYPVKRRLGSVSIELQGRDSLLQDFIKVSQAVLNHFVKPLEFLLCIGDGCLEL